jgi:hypothetical protein
MTTTRMKNKCCKCTRVHTCTINAAEGIRRALGEGESDVHIPTVEDPGIRESLELWLEQRTAGTRPEDVDWDAIRPEFDRSVHEGQEHYIAATGRVVIAEEILQDGCYSLVREENKVRITADTPETRHSEFLFGPYKGSSSLAPPSHMARLLKLADEGADLFKKRTEKVRRAINECPALDIDILLFKIAGHFTELRCEAGKSGQLSRKLGFESLAGLLRYLNSTTPPGSPIEHGIRLSHSSSIEAHSSESYVVAAEFSCKNQTEPNEDTRCIVFHAPEIKYRMWTWGYAQSLYSCLTPCGPEEQLHKPDEPLLQSIEEWSGRKGRGFRGIAHTVITVLTSRYTENFFVHTILVTIDDAGIWQKLVEKRRDRTNTRPLRCSKSRFINAGGKESAFIDALQLDTEDGRAYHEVWKERKGTRLGKKADKRKQHQQQAGTLERMDKLASEVENLKNGPASRHNRKVGVSMSPGSWKVFLDCVVRSSK